MSRPLAPAPGVIPHDQLDQAIAWLNSQHALVYDGTDCVIWTTYIDPTLRRRQWRQSSLAAFRAFYGAYQVPTGGRLRSLADIWLSHADAKRYQEVVFDPGASPTSGVLNLWRGFALDPQPGDWSRLREHLYEIVAGGNEVCYDYLMNWMACMVQRPTDPAGTAIVLRGRQGAGKGIVARLLGQLLGDHFIHLSHTGQLTNRFNAVLVNALFVFADEVVWAGDRQGEGALKALITEPTLAIERKGREIVTVRNVVHLLMATNHEWAAPVGLGDRRFCVLDVADARIGDMGYFHDLALEQTNGGAAAFLFDLLAHPLNGYQSHAVPKTIARRDQIIASLGPVDRWLHDCLQMGQIGQTEWREEFTRVDRGKLYEDYLTAMTKWRTFAPANQVWLGRLLHRRIPAMRTTQNSFGRAYLLPSLAESRRAFEVNIGNDLAWPSAEEE